MSTPSWRAAVRTGVPSANRPRLPEGVKTTRASVMPRTLAPAAALVAVGAGAAAAAEPSAGGLAEAR